MKNEEMKLILMNHLQNQAMLGNVKPDALPDLKEFIEEVVDKKDSDLVFHIATLIRDWEKSFGEEDKSLYTLGLRRVIDIIRDDSYKPLSEDHRDFKRPFPIPPREEQVDDDKS